MHRDIKSSGLTHVGMRRNHNEDAIYLLDDLGLYIVADGMGGHAHGEVASAMAVEAISSQLFETNSANVPFSLSGAIKEANSRIYKYSKERLESSGDTATLMAGMGTTVVALYIRQGMACIAHVGDSRAYRLRDSHLELLTQDHSLAAMAAAGRGAFPIPIRTGFKNVITRALGIEPEVEVDVREEPIAEGDLFLLCSDGLTNMVTDPRIHEILSSGLSIQSACETLISEANRNGGRDNISCILVQI